MPLFPPPPLPTPSELLLITDALASPADYLLHQIVLQHYKDTPNNARCIVISPLCDLTRWKAVGTRSGFNITQHVESGALTFLNLGSEFATDDLGGVLSAAYERIRKLLKDSEALSEMRTLMVVEDITSLEWLGISTQLLVHFIRALISLARQSRASLTVRHHLLDVGEPDDLLRHLLPLSAHHIEVRPLASGRSGAVSGELTLHVGTNVEKSEVEEIPRNRSLLYRVTDAGAVYFERGTGATVL